MAVSNLREFFAGFQAGTPSHQQIQVAARFRHALVETRLIPWRRDNQLPETGSFILVGVAVTWNRYDQALVAALDEALADGRADDEIAVFAAEELTAAEEVESYIPGCSTLFKAPTLGGGSRERSASQARVQQPLRTCVTGTG